MAVMSLARILCLATLLSSMPSLAGSWHVVADSRRHEVNPHLTYVHRILASDPDDARLGVDLAFFRSSDFRLQIIDLGEDALTAEAGRGVGFADAFESAGCVAGVNGGFFHPDARPLGLVIASGQRINRLETSKLLSGVLYGDGRGIHLMRRGRFRDRADIDALLQSGPYLVESNRAVPGLSDKVTASRTFVATDWRGHWLLGATSGRISLSDLGDALATKGVLASWPVDRALNLDGGSSTGFYFQGEAGRSAVVRRPWKSVRNLLCIRER